MNEQSIFTKAHHLFGFSFFSFPGSHQGHLYIQPPYVLRVPKTVRVSKNCFFFLLWFWWPWQIWGIMVNICVFYKYISQTSKCINSLSSLICGHNTRVCLRFCCEFLVVRGCNLVLWTKAKPFSHKLILIGYFVTANRSEIRGNPALLFFLSLFYLWALGSLFQLHLVCPCITVCFTSYTIPRINHLSRKPSQCSWH